jgi:hypothetical protein
LYLHVLQSWLINLVRRDLVALAGVNLPGFCFILPVILTVGVSFLSTWFLFLRVIRLCLTNLGRHDFFCELHYDLLQGLVLLSVLVYVLANVRLVTHLISQVFVTLPSSPEFSVSVLPSDGKKGEALRALYRVGN